ncbi:MAG: efflux RND transporter periplasmic adaptor subunit [Planctomycetota bacterium]
MSAIITPPGHSGGLPVANAEHRPSLEQRHQRLGRFLNGLPNLIVFSLLGGVLYLGHHTGWKMPKLSALMGATAAPADDWCSEHLVPETQCIECQPDLFPKRKPFGFCREHGVAECVIHHPELAQTKSQAQRPKYDTTQAIRLMTRPENNSRNTMHLGRVQFTSAESVTKSGVDVDVVQERPMTDAIAANGELRFNPTRVAHLSVRVPGTVAFVFKAVGDTVQPGDTLAIVDAALVGQAKAQLLQATVQVQLKTDAATRMRGLNNTGAIAQKSVIEAEGALQEAEVSLISARQTLTNLGFEIPSTLEDGAPKQIAENLRFLGIPQSLRTSLSSTTSTANLIPVRASFGGVVTASEVVVGEVVDTTQTLFTVADPQQLWLTLNVPQEGAKYVRPGLKVRFRTDADSPEISGPISWISPSIDPQTRTLKVRVVINNPDGKLRDNTFGAAQIILREEPEAIVVPREAVQSTADAQFVFVRDKNYFDKSAPKVFHVRQVRIGAKDEQFVELLAGVLPGEVIATKGSAVLLAQLQRGNLGAGCACHDH